MGVFLAINQKGGLDQMNGDAIPVEADVKNAALLAFGSSVFKQGSAGLKIDTGTKTATAVAGAVTLNKQSGTVTSESLTTAAGAVYTLTITDSAIAASDIVMASVQLGTATTGSPAVMSVTPAAGSLVIKIQNIHASAALNGTILVSFVDFKQ